MFIYMECPIVPKLPHIDCGAVEVEEDSLSYGLPSLAPSHQLRSQSLTGMNVGGQFEDTLSYACPSGVFALVRGDGVGLRGLSWRCVAPGAPGGALWAMSGSLGG
jgi:hypothetical protein